ncbi:MAG: hypothetical protein BGO01_10360 [Armatimonadetes bacterium 55-13]|nr:MAG: hypothetical protein BGO01_10360 [Armatimonadetes bacterium 55-13]
MLGDGVAPEVREDQGERIHCYRWKDLEVLISQGPAKELAKQINGFENFAKTVLAQGKVTPQVKAVLQRIRDTKLIVGYVSEPESLDTDPRARQLYSELCKALRPLVLMDFQIFDYTGKLLLGPGGRFDP